jgi:hypothetical protein
MSNKIKQEKILFRIPPDMGLLKKRQKEFAASLEPYTVEYLKKVYLSLIGKAPAVKKAELIEMIAKALIFATTDSFRKWFDLLPPLTQNILFRLMFTDCLLVSILENEFKETFLKKDIIHSWGMKIQINDKLALDFLALEHCNDQYFFGFTSISARGIVSLV